MRATILLFATAAGAALTGTASANFVGAPITVTATSSLGTGSFSIQLSDGSYNPATGIFIYDQGNTPRPIISTGGQLLGFVDGLTMLAQADPAISLGFAVHSGPVPTTFTISSGLAAFAAINNPSAHSAASLTITDSSGDGTGVTLHGNSSGPFAYQANFNGLVPAGSVYSLHDGDLFTPSPGGTNNESDSNLAPISGAVSSISAAWSFTLTPLDSASGTSNFVVTPAPGAMCLLGLGGVALTRRRL